MPFIEYRERLLKLQHESVFCTMCIRLERLVSAYDSLKKITLGINELLDYAVSNNNECNSNDLLTAVAPILKSIITYQQKGNLSLLADVIEKELSALLGNYILASMEQNPLNTINYYEKNLDALKNSGQSRIVLLLEAGNNEKDNFIKTVIAESGDITFALSTFENDETECITGLSNPYRDALQYVYYNCDVDRMSYTLAGCGMIYEALAILRINYGTPVCICEPDIGFARKLLTYIDLSEFILSSRLTFELGEVKEPISEGMRGGMLLSKMETIAHFDTNTKQQITKYRSLMLPAKENSQLLFFNFNKNINLGDPYVTELRPIIENKRVYLVAGGPSLSPCIPILQSRDNDSIILCVCTSAGKLISNGITPDLVVLIDGLPATEKQVKQPFDYARTQFIYLATAYFDSVRRFKGKRYIVYQEGYNLSEKAAEENNLQLFRSGGSVSTLALDLAVMLGAKEIICLGLDLAYTYNQMHASGVDEINDIENDQGRIILRSTGGEQIFTANTLASYHDWIETYITKTDGLPKLINISDGAYIEGMENLTVDEALKSENK